jgi:hypothetical protein
MYLENHMEMSERLREWRIIVDENGYWGAIHPDYPLEDWRSEVINSDTRQGYIDWVKSCIEAEDNET